MWIQTHLQPNEDWSFPRRHDTQSLSLLLSRLCILRNSLLNPDRSLHPLRMSSQTVVWACQRGPILQNVLFLFLLQLQLQLLLHQDKFSTVAMSDTMMTMMTQTCLMTFRWLSGRDNSPQSNLPSLALRVQRVLWLHQAVLTLVHLFKPNCRSPR